MTTVHPELIAWFPMVGFRPAVWTPPHRADDVDYPRLVPAPDSDVPMLAKYAPPLLDPMAPSADLVASTPTQTITPPIVDYPCNCISPDVPPVAPVPLPASAGLLLAAVVAMALLRRRA